VGIYSTLHLEWFWAGGEFTPISSPPFALAFVRVVISLQTPHGVLVDAVNSISRRTLYTHHSFASPTCSLGCMLLPLSTIANNEMGVLDLEILYINTWEKGNTCLHASTFANGNPGRMGNLVVH